MQEDSIFTKIIKGEIPSYKIYEDDQVLAFLDVHPVQPGHTLVVPKKQIDKVEDLDDATYSHLWSVVKKLMKHNQAVLKVERIAIKTEGFDVPHAHIHLIPCNKAEDFWERRHFDKIDHTALKNMQSRLEFKE